MPALPVPDEAGATGDTGGTADDDRPLALVEAKALSKRFGSYAAVDGVDFAVERGEVFGFLGPNGAGKTTTMRMIACVSPRTDGDLRVLGLDPRSHGAEIRGRIGVVPQDDNLDTELTVWDNLVIYGRYFGLGMAEIRTRAADLLEFARLTDRRDDRVDPLSGGMKRRLTIARGLMNQPELLLLDEPTTGLDPQARHLLWERLYRLKRDGVTLVLTTHYMEEAEQLCDRLVIMDEGRIVAEGSPRSLIARHSTREVVELRYASTEAQEAALTRVPALVETVGAERVEPLADRLLIYTDRGDAIAALLIDDDGGDGTGDDGHASVLVRRSSLEDVFLRLTGRTLED
jgi:lipooligosaccharide transport system ATP-binding protein